MVYRDMTFCISPDCENKCGCKLTEEVIQGAERWWKNSGINHGPPIAMACFCGGDIREAVKVVNARMEARRNSVG